MRYADRRPRGGERADHQDHPLLRRQRPAACAAPHSGGYRDHPTQAAARLAFIRDAQGAGLTLAEIRSVLALRDSGHAPCGHVTTLISERLQDIERRLAELAKTRDALRVLARRAAETDPATCTHDSICTILEAPEK